VRRSDENEFREYVVTRMDRLRRTAYLLCHDWHLADDLVAVTVGKLYRHWSHARGANSLDAYVRTMLLRSWLDERRRPWRREHPTDDLPEIPVTEGADAADRVTLLALLAGLSPRRRAAVVLRFYFDLSVDETAEVLGCSAGTVKSLTARGISAMRARADPPTTPGAGQTQYQGTRSA
jgi:RNA polymerase sigma-70 factor (sigma-E family)